jgi:hypothetical protein
MRCEVASKPTLLPKETVMTDKFDAMEGRVLGMVQQFESSAPVARE